MAYDRVKIYNQAVEAIEKNNLFFVEDIVAFIPCTKKTFYEFYPVDSDELHTLKDLLDTNKIRTKSSIRSKLYKGNKAAELLALYKLIATDDERSALSMHHVDHTTKGQKITAVELSDETIKRIKSDFEGEI